MRISNYVTEYKKLSPLTYFDFKLEYKPQNRKTTIQHSYYKPGIINMKPYEKQ